MADDYMITKVDGMNITDLRVVDLRKILEKRGQLKSGPKRELIERLQQVTKTQSYLNLLVNFLIFQILFFCCRDVQGFLNLYLMLMYVG